jgi:hypothetical protein
MTLLTLSSFLMAGCVVNPFTDEPVATVKKRHHYNFIIIPHRDEQLACLNEVDTQAMFKELNSCRGK